MAATRLVLVVRPATHGTRAPLPWLQHARVANETLIRRAHKFQIHRKKKRGEKRKKEDPRLFLVRGSFVPPQDKKNRLRATGRLRFYLFIYPSAASSSLPDFAVSKKVSTRWPCVSRVHCLLADWLADCWPELQRAKQVQQRGVSARAPLLHIHEQGHALPVARLRG